MQSEQIDTLNEKKVRYKAFYKKIKVKYEDAMLQNNKLSESNLKKENIRLQQRVIELEKEQKTLKV